MHLKIIRKQNVEGENRGWEIDNLEFFINDSAIGYISIENIPGKNIEKYYPNGAYSYFRKVAGFSISDNIDELTEHDYKYMIIRCIREYEKNKMTLQKILEYEKFKNLTTEKKILYFNRLSLSWKDFKNFHVNRPYPAYIKLYNHGEKRQFFLPQKTRLNYLNEMITITNQKTEDRYFNKLENPSWRGMGLGKILYLEASLFLEEKGLHLHQSGLITDEAKKSWNRINDDFNCVDKKESKIYGRDFDTYFNPEKIERNFYPEWITEISIYDENDLKLNIDNPILQSSLKI